MRSHKLKSLKGKLEDLLAKKGELGKEISAVDREISETRKQITITTQKPVVSEHAMLRYIERVLGVDLDEVRSSILTDEVKERMEAFGNGRYPIGGGWKAVTKENVVTTVID